MKLVIRNRTQTQVSPSPKQRLLTTVGQKISFSNIFFLIYLFFLKILFFPFSPQSPPVDSCVFFVVGPSSCGMWDAASAWSDEQCHVRTQDSNRRNTGPPAAECANLTTRPRGQPLTLFYFLRIVLVYRGLCIFFYILESLSVSTRLSWDFDWNCIDWIDQSEENGNLSNIQFSNVCIYSTSF